MYVRHQHYIHIHFACGHKWLCFMQVEGVKGPSWLAAIPHYDVICGTTVDYMHAILLGVCCQQLKLWLDSTYHKELWYLGNKFEVLDERLSNIKPPSEIKRTPRSIRTTRKYWKGS